MPVPLPLLGLGARSLFSLAKNKKAREALTKSVGGFLGRREKLATTAKDLKNEGSKTTKFLERRSKLK